MRVADHHDALRTEALTKQRGNLLRSAPPCVTPGDIVAASLFLLQRGRKPTCGAAEVSPCYWGASLERGRAKNPGEKLVGDASPACSLVQPAHVADT
jgi:proline racemase